MKLVGKYLTAVLIVLGLFAISWGVGHCNRWLGRDEKPEPPPPIPGGIDAGEETPANVQPGAPGEHLAPAVPAPREKIVIRTVARDLTREELLAKLAEYGLEVGPADRVMPLEPDPAAPLEPRTFEPRLLAEETFCMKRDAAGHCPVGATTGTPTLDVAAWFLCDGCELDLRGKWRTYQPPAPPKPKRGWLGNEGRFVGKIGAGVTGACVELDGEMHCDGGPGGGAGVALRGWRTGKATWSLELEGGAWAQGGTGHAWLTITWP